MQATPSDEDFLTFQQILYISIQDHVNLTADGDMHLSNSPKMHVDPVPNKQSPDDDYLDSIHQ
jgi:hypothetical protein